MRALGTAAQGAGESQNGPLSHCDAALPGLDPRRRYICTAELLWDAQLFCVVAVEQDSWSSTENLYR